MSDAIHLDQEITAAIRAESNDSGQLADLLSRYRPALRLFAEQLIGHKLRRREDASDVVQRTLMDANDCIADFRGNTDAEFSAWIKQILRRKISNLIRDHRAGKRDIRLEQYPDEGNPSISFVWISPRTGNRGSSTPSVQVVRDEAALKLAAAIETLPSDQQEAIRQRYFQGLAVAEIARGMGKSRPAVAGLLRRGIASLRAECGTSSAWL